LVFSFQIINFDSGEEKLEEVLLFEARGEVLDPGVVHEQLMMAENVGKEQ